MGQWLDYSFPGLTSASERLLTANPTIIRDPQYSDHPRLLIAAFLPDQPNLLSKMLAAIKHGVPSEAGLSESRVAFSIEGSVTSAASNTFLMAFVVAPYLTLRPEQSVVESMCESLRKELLQAFATEVEAPLLGAAAKDRIQVHPFEILSDDLFSARRFTEYHFTSGDNSAEGLRVLSEAVHKIASMARERNLPIAYIYFPDARPSLAEAGVPLLRARVAMATPSNFGDKLEFELEVAGVAVARRVGLAIYSPDPTVKSMDARMKTILASPEARRSGDDAATRVVCVVDPARVGLVAGMLDNGVAERLRGGTMTVLGGRTVACWVCAESDGPRVEEAIKSNLGAGPERVFSAPGADSTPPELGVPIGVWLRWDIGDHAGVFLGMVEAFNAAVYELGGVADYRYSLSRVIAGSRCAGKTYVHVTGVHTTDPTSLGAELGDRLVSSGWWQDVLQKDRGPRPVLIVSLEEPGEEPWASLVAGFNPGPVASRDRLRCAPMNDGLIQGRLPPTA